MAEFIAGVIEGFYGRPWSFDQRKDLFTCMRQFEFTVYIYAPKDDLKHRAQWRDLYTDEECRKLF